MVTKTFFRKVAALQQNLDLDIKKILELDQEKVMMYQKILMKIDLSIRALKKLKKNVLFDSVAEEITFFKIHKPYFISQYIFFSKALNMEISKPSSGNKVLKKYFQTELTTIKNEIRKDIHFYDYYRREATYLDHKYFTTNANDHKMKMSLHLYDFDEDFTTTHDHKLALIKANERWADFINAQIDSLEQSKSAAPETKTKISWTSNKVSLLEILYALHLTQCFNGGNIEFGELVRETEKILAIELGNCYKTIGEIKNRKYNKTKFLQLLMNNLNKTIDDHNI